MKNTEIELLIHEVVVRSMKGDNSYKGRFYFKYVVFLALISMGWFFLSDIDSRAYFVLSLIGLSILSLVFLAIVSFWAYLVVIIKKQIAVKGFIYKLESNLLGFSRDKNKVYINNVTILGKNNYLSIKNISLNKEEALKLTNLLKKYFNNEKVESILLNSTENGEIKLSSLAQINYLYKAEFEKEIKEEERKIQAEERKTEEKLNIDIVKELMKDEG